MAAARPVEGDKDGGAIRFLPAAVGWGGLAGLLLGLYLGAQALVNRPATGIGVLRLFARDILQLLYVPALACLGLGLAAGLLLWIPATIVGRRRPGAGLGLLITLIGAGAFLAPWWSSLLPPGQPLVRMALAGPVLFNLLSALAISLAAGAGLAVAALGLWRRGHLGRAGILLTATWSSGTLLVLGLALGAGRGGAGLTLLVAAGAAALFLLLVLPPGLRGGPGRPWSVPAAAVLAVLHLAVGLIGAAVLPEVTADDIRPAARAGADRRPNIILVSVDTLRADRLSCYGAERASSPALDRFSREAVLFQRMTSNSPWTLPAMSSLFTGRLPAALGMDGGPARLPASVPTLASSLAGEGYFTRAIATNPWLKREFGFHRGFHGFTHLEEGGVASYQLQRMFWHRLLLGGPGGGDAKDRIRAGRVTDRALEWLGQVPPDSQPFFLWLHYMDPHEPYSPSPVPATGSYRGRFIDSSGLVSSIMAGGLLGPDDVERLRLLYDEEILVLDRQLGRLLASLRTRGLLDRSVVVVTADHGEEFLEHGGLGHGHTLYDELLRVPLLVRLPGGEAALAPWRSGMQLIDLLPTLLSLAGGSVPPGVQGRDMADLFDDLPASLDGEPGLGPLAVLSEGTQDAVSWKSLEKGEFKLILDRSSGRSRLFHTDPLAGGEVDGGADGRYSDLAAELARRIREIDRESRELAVAAAAAGPLDPDRMTPEMRRQLQSLGYLE